jgi:opacity protein-like surface antigen
MKMKVTVCLLGFLSVLVATVHGQEFSKLDLFAGYSYVRANPNGPTLPSFNMNGGEASLAYNANSWLSGVVDFAGYRTSQLTSLEPRDFKGNMYTYLFGPRISYRHLGRFTPFTQTLFGIAHATSGTYGEGNQTNFAMTVGGGFDFRLSRRISIRPIQADYLLTHFKEFESFEVNTNNSTQNNVRLSTGVVFHF